ncbi:MAG: MBOAT family protein [Cyanobacteria bacterium P01_F01_bin.13]
MLFNSPVFIFIFLPVVLLGFLIAGQIAATFPSLSQRKVLIFWLIITSLVFYGFFKPWNLVLIIASVIINYRLGLMLGNKAISQLTRKIILFCGIGANLLAITYFKYAAFIVENINGIFHGGFPVPEITLPIAISFFTFQQIAYLVDAYKKGTQERSFINYIFFITFFPQLIAGPIVHHSEVLPQIENKKAWRFESSELAIGLTVFVMGLFKKVILADNVARFATPVFEAAAQNIAPTFTEAWIGALAYTLQLYFDFSGYSDMAIGLAYMFGIQLPINFFSPYQAISITDFWRRWHITLSNFLRDYLYIPLGGSRKGNLRRHMNLMMTMLLGGLWHGAGWNFIFWGGLHGTALIINHQWRAFRLKLGHSIEDDSWISKRIGWGLTFLFVVVAWVYFRASTFSAANIVLASMVGANGIELPNVLQPLLGSLQVLGVGFEGFSLTLDLHEMKALLWVTILLLIVFLMPNTKEWMGGYSPVLHAPSRLGTLFSENRIFALLQWRPGNAWSLIMAVTTAVSILALNQVSEFLYFQF